MTELPIRPDTPWLAPLAGWSDLPFRLLCREQGAAVCCTEMVSAKGLVYGGRNTEELLATTLSGGEYVGELLVQDAPLVVQIFGADESFMQQAVDILMQRGFRWFDINMGCSVPKVTKTGAGAAMLRDVPNALRVAEAVLREAGPGHVGFKLRLGWDSHHEVYHELAAGLAERGAGWITLHPRTAVQGFSGTPRYGALAELAGELPVPILASGDLFTASDGVRILRETGVASVMYARGALRDPSIFSRHRLLWSEGAALEPHAAPNYKEGEVIPAQRACEVLDDIPAETEVLEGIIRRHALLARRYSPQRALLKMRTVVPRYVRSVDGARSLRQALVSCSSWDELERILNCYFGRGSGEIL